MLYKFVHNLIVNLPFLAKRTELCFYLCVAAHFERAEQAITWALFIVAFIIDDG